MNDYYVYILACDSNSTVYIGVTNDLKRRIAEHKSGQIEGFTKNYHVHKLVYFENCHDINAAILREKQLKKWSRKKKNTLIESQNPQWKDLSENE